MKSVLSVIFSLLLFGPLFTGWAAIVAILLRPLGIHLPVLIWRRSYGTAIEKLSRGQLIIVVVLVWSIGLYLLRVISDYVDLKFGLRGPVHFSPEDLVSNVIIGICFGWVMWNYGPHGKPLGSNYENLSISPKHHD